MGIFNEHSSTSSHTIGCERGLRGPAGIGFVLVLIVLIVLIHKPTITGRPIISGCDGPTERISSFVDTLLQPISKSQVSYLKDTTDFINFIEKTKVKR